MKSFLLNLWYKSTKRFFSSNHYPPPIDKTENIFYSFSKLLKGFRFESQISKVGFGWLAQMQSSCHLPDWRKAIPKRKNEAERFCQFLPSIVDDFSKGDISKSCFCFFTPKLKAKYWTLKPRWCWRPMKYWMPYREKINIH